MKTFDLIRSAISHNLKDPYSKALEPDCLSPPLPIMTQSPTGEELIFWLNCVNIIVPVTPRVRLFARRACSGQVPGEVQPENGELSNGQGLS